MNNNLLVGAHILYLSSVDIATNQPLLTYIDEDPTVWIPLVQVSVK